MTDLGTLPGDVNSAALAINERGEVVGGSVDAMGNLRPFLRANGVMMDLGTLVPVNSAVVPVFASMINSHGEIVGFGLTGDGDVHAFLATPSSGSDTGLLSSAVQDRTSPMLLSEDARKVLQQRLRFTGLGGRFVGRR